MNKPVLVIMAAGMGSRFGGLKQIEPVDDFGHIIMDFSIYDAKLAGFEKVVFIIKEENYALFRDAIGKRAEEKMKVAYVFQNLLDIPKGYEVPDGRVKPWGTGHAVLSAANEIDGPFAVINADDYYGRDAFKKIFDFLSTTDDDEKYRYVMIGYMLQNTLTENGSVARGVCVTDENQYLTGVVERTQIEKRGDGAAFTEDGGQTWTELPMDTTVSMNMWGFTNSFLGELKTGFVEFFEETVPGNPLKSEYFLPTAVNKLLHADKATVTVLKSMDKWYGVTYKEDKEVVVAAIRKMEEDGKYPSDF